MTSRLDGIVDLARYPIAEIGYARECKEILADTGSLLLPGFLTDEAVTVLRREARDNQHLAFYCQQSHSAYLSAADPAYPSDHPSNRRVESSKGCITDDQVPAGSLLRTLYHDEHFREFLCRVLDERALHAYADPLSSINVHYYQEGQELGWHFDNSSFAVTLMIQPPQAGGQFEYITSLRDYDAGDMNFAGVGKALDGMLEPVPLDIGAGTLALFRGRNSLHRVTPVEGAQNRIQVVLAYNTEPGIALSEQARMTFYGRTG